MKMHRSTQLFLYCSGGECSVKCVCPAMEMEARKEEQRGLVRFLLAEGAGTHEVSRMSAVYGEHSVLDRCAQVAEEILRRMHITARRFVPGTSPLSRYT